MHYDEAYRECHALLPVEFRKFLYHLMAKPASNADRFVDPPRNACRAAPSSSDELARLLDISEME
jgi:hypothetical protein